MRWTAFAGRTGGAVLLNVLLLAALTRLNRTEVAQADPAVVARLRLPAAPDAPKPAPKEPLPVEESHRVELPVLEPRPETPVAALEPLALPGVQLGVDVPVIVRPMPVVRRQVEPKPAPRVAKAAPVPPRTLGSDEVDEPPTELEVPAPSYPPSAIRTGTEGSATVKLLIDEKGRVVEVKLVDTRGSRLFGQAVLAVAPDWRFAPARDHGTPVRVWAVKTVHFRLRRNP